jgi:hypothetical protein
LRLLTILKTPFAKDARHKIISVYLAYRHGRLQPRRGLKAAGEFPGRSSQRRAPKQGEKIRTGRTRPTRRKERRRLWSIASSSMGCSKGEGSAPGGSP